MSTITIGDIAVNVSKGTTPTSIGLSFSNKGVPFIRGEDVVGYSVDFNRVKMFINDNSHNILKRSALMPGDVLVTIAGTIGRTGYIDKQSKPANCNQAVAFIRLPLDRVDPIWLCALLSSPKYQTKFGKFVAGGAIPNVNLEQIKSLEIPLINIEEQQQIATKLKSQLAEVETARKALVLQQQEIVNLANAFIRESIKQTSVTETRLGEVLEEVKKGIGENWADYPVLGATRGGLAAAKTVGAGHARDLSHVAAYSRAWPAPTREPPGKHPQRYKPVFSGTVFYNPMRILIGSIAFVDDDDEPGITSPDYVALQGKAGQVDSRWFYYWLRSPYGEQCINSLARGAVRERMLFNRLAEGSILLPSYQEQLRVSKALAILKPVKYAIQKQLDDLDKIPERLLAQAFNYVVSK